MLATNWMTLKFESVGSYWGTYVLIADKEASVFRLCAVV